MLPQPIPFRIPMANNITHISILGCGWLGLPLAQKLIEDGFSVKGSTTSDDKIDMLRDHGIVPFKIILTESDIIGNIDTFLRNCDILIIDIPPKVRAGGDFAAKIKVLIPLIETAQIGKVIFISSTSVYADDNGIVTEETVPNPDTESGRQLVVSERLLQNGNFQSAIIRFGGLIGGDRHPIHSLSGKTSVANPDAPINLIHRDDCIGIIEAVIQQQFWGRIINGVAPYHPTRKEFYVAQAMVAGLDPPQFNDEPSIGKTVNLHSLQYPFIHQKL